MNCDIDWPVTFAGFSTFLTPLADASWPIGLLLALWIFRPEIKHLLSRVRTIKGAGVEAELHADTQQQEATAVAVAPAFGNEYPPPHPVFSGMDEAARAIIDQSIAGDLDKKFAWAIRMRSISEAYRIHEANYRVIFGSQIRALRALNVIGRGKVSDFERYFEEVKISAESASLHEDRTFEQWGEFLVQAGYVAEAEGSDGSEVQITPFGQQFLLWLTEARVYENRPG